MSVSRETLDAFNQTPINQLLELTLISRSEHGAVVSMAPKPEYAQETGVLHGGVLSAIADTAAVYAFMPDLSDEQSMTSIEFKVNFVEAARPNDGPIIAKSSVVRRGRTIGVCDVDVMQLDRLVAKGIFTYIFLDKRT